MNNWLSILVLTVTIQALYSVVHSESKIYKYVDENGKVVYTSNPPNHTTNVKEIELIETNTIPSYQIKAKQNEVMQKHDSVTNRIKQRISDREKRTAEIKAAKLEVAKKKEALEKGKIPLPGERIGTGVKTPTGYATRLTEAHYDRLELLEKELTIAEDILNELQNNKK